MEYATRINEDQFDDYLLPQEDEFEEFHLFDTDVPHARQDDVFYSEWP
jgi:hypothetical protein